jgi:hypothetical protein
MIEAVRWRLAVIAVVVAGCKPHVTLVPPPAGASPEQRVQAFNQLHAVSEKTTWTTSCGGGGGCSTTVEKTLYLANGTQVHHEEDILPLLPPDSEPAREVHAAQRARSRQTLWALGAVGGFLGSFILLAQADHPGLGLGIGLGFGVVGGWFAYQNHYEAADHVSRANATYNAGLARTLNVCVAGFYVVPCETSTTPTPPPLPPQQQ